MGTSLAPIAATAASGAGIAGWLAPAVAGVSSAVGAFFQNKWNREAAREQMAFQERMSSTAYQRSMDDMRKAGLNPMLAIHQGGASSPAGAMPQLHDVMGPAVSNALHARRLRNELQIMEQTAANEHLRGYNIAAERDEITSRIRLNDAHAASLQAATALELARLPYEQKRGNVAASRFGTVAAFLDRLTGWMGAAGGFAAGAGASGILRSIPNLSRFRLPGGR